MELLIHFRNGKQAKLTYSDPGKWDTMRAQVQYLGCAGWTEMGLQFEGDNAIVNTSSDRVEFLEYRP